MLSSRQLSVRSERLGLPAHLGMDSQRYRVPGRRAPPAELEKAQEKGPREGLLTLS
jgi:hypothetical protein